MESKYNLLDEQRKAQEDARLERNRMAFSMTSDEFDALKRWFEAKFFVHLPAFDGAFDAQKALARDTARRVFLEMEREWKKQQEEN